MPIPVSDTATSHLVVDGAHGEPDRPLRRVLDGVREQVEHDPLEHVTVQHGADAVVAVVREVEPRPLRRRTEALREATGELGHVDDGGLRLQPPGLHPAEVEHGVDHPGEPAGAVVDELEPAPLLLRVVLDGERLLQRPADERQRGAQLVADVREERALGLVELDERLAPATLLRELAAPRSGRPPRGSRHRAWRRPRGPGPSGRVTDSPSTRTAPAPARAPASRLDDGVCVPGARARRRRRPRRPGRGPPARCRRPGGRGRPGARGWRPRRSGAGPRRAAASVEAVQLGGSVDERARRGGRPGWCRARLPRCAGPPRGCPSP